MEDPKSWGKAEHVVSAVIVNHERNRAEAKADPSKLQIGLSLTKQITNALRTEGLLVDDRDE